MSACVITEFIKRVGETDKMRDFSFVSGFPQLV